jgi:tRNA A37 N6-isopentenylltransferase MiaA
MDLTAITPNSLRTGFREFHQYLTDPSPSEKKYRVAVENLKTANHQYSKRQLSWIRNKLLPAVRAAKTTEGATGVELYLLDATGLHLHQLCLKKFMRASTLILDHIHRAPKMDI